ncbi:MAG TPA: PAS domain S-box protein [Desulfomonilia bacterium]
MSRFIDITEDCEAVIKSSVEQIGKVSDIEMLALYSVKNGEENQADIYIKLDNGEGLPLHVNERLNNIKKNFPYIFDKLEKNIPVTETDEIFYAAGESNSKKLPKSIIFLPVVVDNLLWGFVFCIHRTDYDWKARDLSLFIELTHKISSSLSRKNQIIKLYKEKESCHFLMENISDLVVMADENNAIVSISGDMIRSVGYYPEEILGRQISSLISEDDRERFNHDSESFRKGRLSGEYRIVFKNGSVKWAGVLISPIYEDNSYKGCWFLFADIDEIMKAHEKTAESEALYRMLLENAQDIIWTMDPDFKMTFLSPSGEKIGWTSCKEINLAGIKEFLGGAQHMNIRNTLQEYLISAGKGPRDENPFRLFTYEHINPRTLIKGYIETKISILRKASGEIAGFIGISRDCTERKKMVDNLLSVESRQRYLLDNIQDILLCHDMNAKITYISDNIKQLTGYDPSEITGKSAGDFVHPDMKKYFEENLDRFRTTREGGVHEYKLIHKDGTEHWYRLNTKPNFDEAGRFIEVVAVMANIDKYKEVEKYFEITEKKENLYQHIVGKVQDLVWASSLDYMTIYMSPSIKTALGYTVEEALGMEFGTTFKPESLSRVMAVLREARAAVARGDYNFSAELTVNQFKRNRRTLKGNLRISILCDTQNNPYGYLGITSFRKRGPNVKSQGNPELKKKKRGRPRGRKNSI